MDNQDAPGEKKAEQPVAPPTAGIAAPPKSRVPVARIIVFVAVGTVLGVLIYFSPRFFNKEEPSPKYPHLTIGGTSAGSILVTNLWQDPYRKGKGIQLDYEPVGSTRGVTGMIDGKYTVAFTHSGLSEEQRSKARSVGGEVIHFPILICGVVPIYNIPELKDKPPLNFTGEVLGEIFLGKITTWKNEKLEKLNPGVALPATPITVVHRQDSSGTTHLFTEYLTLGSSAWREKFPKPSSEVAWPVGVGANQNPGVATRVYETPGAIGYVDRLFTTYGEMVLQYGAVQNEVKTPAGFVRAEPDNMAAALQGALPKIPEDLTFGLADKPGPTSYPICGVIYAVCYQNQKDSTRQQVTEFIQWATHEGQETTKKLHSAPLPPELVTRIDQRLKLIKAP